jgi:hypothetical protein
VFFAIFHQGVFGRSKNSLSDYTRLINDVKKVLPTPFL